MQAGTQEDDGGKGDGNDLGRTEPKTAAVFPHPVQLDPNRQFTPSKVRFQAADGNWASVYPLLYQIPMYLQEGIFDEPMSDF